MGKVAIVTFILFPYDLSKKTQVAMEEGDGLLITTLTQGDTRMQLDKKETFKLKEILGGLKELPNPNYKESN